MSHAWRKTCGLSDDALFNQIVEDEIDILVDLAGHTAGNRLTVFTRRPAPIQVTYLGYPGQTGLRSEAYCFVDNVVQPRVDDAGDESHFRYLEPCFCCFAPNYETPPISELPASQAGYITFGMLHGLSKLNGDVYDLWCDVLKAVPDSKLLMFRTSLTGASLNRVRANFLAAVLQSQELSCVPNARSPKPSALLRPDRYHTRYFPVEWAHDLYRGIMDGSPGHHALRSTACDQDGVQRSQGY